MNNVLKNLKVILSGFTEEELQNYDLWINDEEGVGVIVIEENSISLITNSKELKIDDRDKNLVKES